MVALFVRYALEVGGLGARDELTSELLVSEVEDEIRSLLAVMRGGRRQA